MRSVFKVFFALVLGILSLISIGLAFLTGFAGCMLGSVGGGIGWFIGFLLIGLFLMACAVVLGRRS